MSHFICRTGTLTLVLSLAAAIACAQPPHNPNQIQNTGSQTTKSGGNATIQGAINNQMARDAGLPAGQGVPTGFGANPLAKTAKVTEQVASFAQSITANDLYAHLSFLASEELEGRETAMRGQKVAARYLAAQFAKMGLKPGNNGKWYQPFELEQVYIKSLTATLDGKTVLTAGKEFFFYSKNGLSSSKSLSWVFAGYGISDNRYDNLDGLNLKGKAAVILAGEPMKGDNHILSGSTEPSEWTKVNGKKSKALMEAGAEFMVVVVPDDVFQKTISNNWVQHRMEGKGLKLAYKENDGLPAIYISEKSLTAGLKKSGYTWQSLKETLAGKDDAPKLNFGKNELALTSDAVVEKVVSENVLGMLEGTDKKDEFVVITAHYDHLGVRDGEIFYGADDDGSGTAAVLEIAEAFALAAKAGVRPRRSILFMPVSGEEKGLMGSEFYSDHPVIPLKKTACNLNIDMIGRLDKEHEKDSNYVYIIGSDMLSSDLHRANEVANNLMTQIKLDYTYNSLTDRNQFYYRSDHYNFAKHDIPVIFYFTGVHADYHKSTDTIDKIMFGKAAKIAQLVFGTAWEVANLDEMPVVDRKNAGK